MKVRSLAAGPWIPIFLLAFGAEGDPFMGRWEGKYLTESSETGPFVVQVIPEGGNSYRLWVRMGERGSRYEIRGSKKDSKLIFKGRFQVVEGTDDASYDLSGEIDGPRLIGTFASPEASGRIELLKVRNAISGPREKPAGAISLFDGTGLDQWQRPDGGKAEWKIGSDGSMEAGGTDLVSRPAFAGLRLHVEFLLPLMAQARGQERANSGVVLAGSHEIHIIDTFGLDPKKDSCGAIFGIAAPRLDACLPPLEWQAFDITLRAPLSDADAKVARSPEISVMLNGINIHDRLKLDGFRAGPIRLRWAGSAVRFRNIWLQRLED